MCGERGRRGGKTTADGVYLGLDVGSKAGSGQGSGVGWRITLVCQEYTRRSQGPLPIHPNYTPVAVTGVTYPAKSRNEGGIIHNTHVTRDDKPQQH